MTGENAVLRGIRVIDCSVIGQGPAVSALMADLGAEVIKIEDPVRGDPIRGMSSLWGRTQHMQRADGETQQVGYLLFNRGKKCITLNLKTAGGRDALYRLVRKSHVFVHNYLPRVVAELGIGYEWLKEVNEKLIYVEVTGFGSNGPHRAWPGLDMTAMARSGIMTTITGNGAEEPQYPVGAVADVVGATCACLGTIAALYVLQRDGVGQKVEASQLGGMIWMQSLNFATALLTGKPFKIGSRKDAPNPLYNHYQCADGEWLALGCVQADRHWPVVCEAIGRGDLIDDERFADMKARECNSRQLIAILDDVFVTKPFCAWEAVFSGKVLFSKVNDISEAVSDPQVEANGYLQEIDDPKLGKVKLPGAPFGLSETPPRIAGRAPDWGEHTVEILTTLCGYSEEELASVLAGE